MCRDKNLFLTRFINAIAKNKIVKMNISYLHSHLLIVLSTCFHEWWRWKDICFCFTRIYHQPLPLNFPFIKLWQHMTLHNVTDFYICSVLSVYNQFNIRYTSPRKKKVLHILRCQNKKNFITRIPTLVAVEYIDYLYNEKKKKRFKCVFSMIYIPNLLLFFIIIYFSDFFFSFVNSVVV